MKGVYIVFEGIVGCGKTTQSKLLLEYLQTKFPDRKVVWTREPGGSEVADAIRKVVQGTPFDEHMDPVCEAYLYAASRAQTLRSIVMPALNEGSIVISDRSFMTSISFQGSARGLGAEFVKKVNAAAVNVLPHIVLFIDVSPKVGLTRTFDDGGDKFEKEGAAFFDKARKGYLALEKDYAKIFKVIDGNGSIEEVSMRVQKTLDKSGVLD